MTLCQINKDVDKSVGQPFLTVLAAMSGRYRKGTDLNVCSSYCPMDGLTAGFQSADRRPPLNDWTKLITPI